MNDDLDQLVQLYRGTPVQDVLLILEARSERRMGRAGLAGLLLLGAILVATTLWVLADFPSAGPDRRGALQLVAAMLVIVTAALGVFSLSYLRMLSPPLQSTRTHLEQLVQSREWVLWAYTPGPVLAYFALVAAALATLAALAIGTPVAQVPLALVAVSLIVFTLGTVALARARAPVYRSELARLRDLLSELDDDSSEPPSADA